MGGGLTLDPKVLCTPTLTLPQREGQGRDISGKRVLFVHKQALSSETGGL